MTTKNYRVMEIDKVKGGKADRFVVYYEGTDGTPWKIGGLVAKLPEDSRSVLNAVCTEMPIKTPSEDGNTIKYSGKTVNLNLSMVKEGNYWNLTSAKAVDSTNTQTSSPTYSKTTTPAVGRLTDVEKAHGQQRGNVLTNAVTLVAAAGVTDIDRALRQVEKTALALLAVSNNLETAANTPPVETYTSDDDVVPELGY